MPQRSFAPQHDLSQLITSFIAIKSQGIRQLFSCLVKILLYQYVKEPQCGEYRSRTDDLLNEIKRSSQRANSLPS